MVFLGYLMWIVTALAVFIGMGLLLFLPVYILLVIVKEFIRRYK